MAKSTPDFGMHTGAKGGASLGRHRDFLKESDGADQTYTGTKPYQNPDKKDSVYGKKAAVTVHKGHGNPPAVNPVRTGDKSMKPVKPRS